MLRIVEQTAAANVLRYYTEGLNRDDYYAMGTERPGVWHGLGAELLGLTGSVQREQFARLTGNQHPSKDERLTQRTKYNRRIGYDISFHAPKSISVVYAVTQDEALLWAFSKSVWETMAEMETMMQTRVRRDGADYDRDTKNMVWAEYVHLTTRPVDGEPDPHVHSHNFAFNCSFDHDEQRWKAGQFGELIRRQPYFQSAFLSRLATNVVSVGYSTRLTEHAFEIDGVSRSLIERCSRRTVYIESVADDLGIEGDQKARLGARTRERKRDDLSIDELHERWVARMTPAEIDGIIQLKERSRGEDPALKNGQSFDNEGPRPSPDAGADVGEEDGPAVGDPPPVEARWGPQLLVSLSANNAVKQAMRAVFERQAIVAEYRLREQALRLSHGRATPGQIADSIAKRPELIRRQVDGETYITTKEAVAEERMLVQYAKEGRGAKRALGATPLSLSTLKLDRHDKEVLAELLACKDRLALFKCSGPSRKPALTRAALTGIYQAGYEPYVLAPTNAAAREAEQQYGLDQVHSVYRVLNDDSDLRKPTEFLRRVYWVEDAGRLGTRDIARLVELAWRRGARIVLSGDDSRSRRYGRGDPFRLLREEAGLTTAERRVLREKENDLEKAVASITEDRGQFAIELLRKLDKLVEARSDDDVLRNAVEFFDREHERGRAPLLVAPTAWDAESLITAVRERLRERGVLHGRERSLPQLTQLGVDKTKHDSYRRGLVIDFHMPTRGFLPGDRTRVLGVDPMGGVWVRGKGPVPVRLRLAHADRFTVSEVQRGRLAVGDRIRLTKTVRPVLGTRGRKPLRSNTVVTVTGFNPLGQVVVKSTGTQVLPRNFGHFQHEYATSVSKMGGRRADSVAFVASSTGWAHLECKDLASAGEAARKEFKVIVEDSEALENVINHQRPGVAATDLTDRPGDLEVEFEQAQMRFEQAQADHVRGYRHGV